MKKTTFMDNRLFFKFICIVICLYVLMPVSIWAQVSIKVDKSSANYEVNEAIKFTIQSTLEGTASYSIQYHKYTSVLQEGSITLNANEVKTISFTPTEPGAVICQVTFNGIEYHGGAVIDPYHIHPVEEEPDDFDNFWTAQKTQLAKIPLDPKLEEINETEYLSSYKISLALIDNRRVYGYLSIPKGDGLYPGLLTMPPFGDSPSIVEADEFAAERAGMITLSISIHNAPLNQVDPDAYQPDVSNSKEDIYYRYALLAGVRAIDYVFSRDDFDGKNMAVTGLSQGGGLALMVAGLDQRVSLTAYSTPSFCEHTGMKYDKASGFPFFIRNSRTIVGTPIHETQTVEATKYYDAVNFAKRYKGPAITGISYLDPIAPPATQFAAYNELTGPTVIVHWINQKHENSPEFLEGRFDWYRRFIPATNNPPWPWPDATTGYAVNAGKDTLISLSDKLVMLMELDKDGRKNPIWPLLWEVLEGPGQVNFSNPTSQITEAEFTAPGTYKIRAMATDSYPQDPNKYITIADIVEVTVTNDSEPTELEQVQLFKVFPNPNPGDFSVKAIFNEERSYKIEVFNSLGQLVRLYKGVAQATDQFIDGINEPGVYYIMLHVSTGRLVKSIVVVPNR